MFARPTPTKRFSVQVMNSVPWQRSCQQALQQRVHGQRSGSQRSRRAVSIRQAAWEERRREGCVLLPARPELLPRGGTCATAIAVTQVPRIPHAAGSCAGERAGQVFREKTPDANGDERAPHTPLRTDTLAMPAHRHRVPGAVRDFRRERSPGIPVTEENIAPDRPPDDIPRCRLPEGRSATLSEPP